MSAAAAAPAAAAPKGKKKLILIVAVVLLLVAVGGGTALFMKKSHDAEAAAAEEGEDGGHAEKKVAKKEKKKEEKHTPPVFVPLDPFVVNLADRDTDRFAQVGITLEVEDAHAADQIKAYVPAIRNNVLLLLGHKKSDELMTPDGKEVLARQLRRVAVEPMGIELEDEDAEEAPPEPGKKRKRKQYDSLDDSPIKSVQFSSFIIQ